MVCLRPPGAKFAQGQTIERDFDDVFGFRAGNQHGGRDFKFEAPEFLFAGEVLRGFALGPAGNQRKETICDFLGKIFFGMGVEPGAVRRGDMEQQEVRRTA